MDATIATDDGDWVPFGGPTPDPFEPFEPFPNETERRRSHRNKKKANQRQSDNGSTASWMDRPINSDSSWMPVAPPQPQEPPESRDDVAPRASVTLGRAGLRPPLVSRRSTSSVEVPSSQHQTGDRNNTRERASNAADPARPPRRGRSPVSGSRQESRGRSTSRTRAPSPANQQSRGRSRSRTRDPPPVRTQTQTRGRSTSRTRAPASAPNRQRSVSRTRSIGTLQSPKATNVTRSTIEAPSPQMVRGHPVRPPLGSSGNRGRSASRTCESRCRSLSRTRQPIAGSPRQSRTMSCSSSIGPGLPPRHGRQERDTRTGGATKSGKGGGMLGRIFHDRSGGTPESSRPTLAREASSQLSRENSLSSVFSVVTSEQPQPVHPRVLLSATVYKNVATNLWIATINTNQKGVATNPATASKYLKAFSFSTEREAREAAIANAPPKMMPFNESPTCFICGIKFAVFRRACHCRNCGACVCSGCTITWPSKMLPETYNLKNESVVKICKGCNYLTDSFRKSLLKGDFEGSIALYRTGNVNLRCPLPNSSVKKSEIMYPIHCAVYGGNLDLVRWLIDEHYCPIKTVRKSNNKNRKKSDTDDSTPILTSKGRSVLSVAMQGLKVDIMRYLVVDKGVSVFEIKDLQPSLKALEAVLVAFPQQDPAFDENFESGEIIIPRWDDANFSDADESYVCSSLGDDQSANFADFPSFEESQPVSTTADMCIICYDNVIDCVITPCGHQICCLECSNNIKNCPVCNVDCSFIRIFKP